MPPQIGAENQYEIRLEFAWVGEKRHAAFPFRVREAFAGAPHFRLDEICERRRLPEFVTLMPRPPFTVEHSCRSGDGVVFSCRETQLIMRHSNRRGAANLDSPVW